MTKTVDDEFTPEEAARRRDEVVRRMANTPPQPQTTNPDRSKNRTKAGEFRQDGPTQTGKS